MTSAGTDGGVPTRTLAAIVAVEFVALGSLTVPLLLGLALAVNRIETSLSREEALSLITAAGAVAALLANPVFGSWADRTRARGAGRASWMLGGVLAGAGCVVLLPLASNVAQLVLVWVLAQASFNATFAALYGMIADLVDEQDRARVSGWFGAAAVGSVVFGMGLATFLPKELDIVLLPMPLLAVPVTVWAFRHLARLPRPDAAQRDGDRPGLAALRGRPQYWWVWWQRLLVQLAYAIVSGYGLFYLIRRADLGEESAATWVSATAASAAALSAVTAILAGRMAGRRGGYAPYIVFSVVLIAAALVLKGFGTSIGAYAAATLLVGVGIGCYYAVDLALVLRTVPPELSGRFLGFFNIARTLPQSLAPSVAPWLLAVGDGDVIGDSSQNYFALYAAGLVVVVLSVLPLRRMTVLRREAPSAVSPQRSSPVH